MPTPLSKLASHACTVEPISVSTNKVLATPLLGNVKDVSVPAISGACIVTEPDISPAIYTTHVIYSNYYCIIYITILDANPSQPVPVVSKRLSHRGRWYPVGQR